ncbi:putative DNA binding protein [Rheinheimera phage vB_RspM_Barba19A]|jgi:hypothetical protein|uniref:Putative DNA binding protein n=2 Tax=Barbavirus barba19A TaxID=2734091 RepID=A0A4P8N7D1_9CAUD|nr:HNH endonuclease [Rheinheimera phage vB_RspM_Barba19A]QCQ61849.1 putative DNA binding protein [Rheinheimera phage vB_RspM_Barba19A]QCQ64599.1 putative DNA binding protein [Rheinheimera phage vB_RspM_Barba31A]
MARKGLVYGVGRNDAEYDVYRTEVVNGKQKVVWRCPYYQKWIGILERCLCPKKQARNPTYKGCTVTEDWRYLSNFIKWVDSQHNKDWQNCEPDKDFLSVGNKHYSPDTVVFVPRKVNNFIIDSINKRGDYMIGVSCEPRSKKNPYLAQCSNPFGGSRRVGLFPTELEAHLAWQTKKHTYACLLADLQTDERVASRLREMYAPDKDWTKV